MAGSLSISITADVADLRAKMALARSELKEWTSQVNELADRARAAGASGLQIFGQGLEFTAAKAAAAKAQIASLAAQIKAAEAEGRGGIMETLGRGFENVRGASETAKRAVEGFLAVLAIERFASVIEGTSRLGEEMEVLSQKTRIPVPALSDLKFAAAQVNVPFETLGAALRGLAVTTEQAIINPASKQAAAYRQLGIDINFLKANQNDLEAILRKVADAYATGGTATQQMENAQLIFLRGGRELLPFLQEGTAGIDRLSQRNAELGDRMSGPTAAALADNARAVKELAAAWEGLEVRLTSSTDALAKATRGIADFIAGVHKENPDDWKKALGEQEIKTAEVEIARLTQLISDLQAKRSTESLFGTALRETDREIADAEHELVDWQRAAASANATLDEMANKGKAASASLPLAQGAAHAAEAASALGGVSGGIGEESPKAKSPWKDLVDGTTQASALAKFREGLAEMRASWDGTNTGMLAQEVQMWAAEVNDAKLNAKEKVEAEKGYADAVRALRLAQRAENEAIARSNADSDIAVAKLRIGAERDTLAAEFQAHEINADQRRALLQNLLNEEFDLNLAELHREEALLQQQPAELARVLNQEKILKAQNAQDMAAIDRQYTADLKRENEEQVRSWRTAIGEIDSAESSLFSDILTKRQKLSVDVAQIIDREIAQEITADARYLTQKLLYNALGLADDQKNATGGLLVHLLAENTKTVATTTGAARRRLAETTEGTNLITQIGQMVGRWVGMEAAKTGATTTGAGEREAVFTAEQLAGQAAAVAAGFSQIQIDAAVAAAGAFAATAPIPYVGPILAPEAAAAAYAETIGWAAGLGGGVAGLDVGAWSVKSSGLAYVHAGESVQPAVPGPNFNQGMAAALAGGGGDAYNINFTIQANDTRTGAAFLKNQAGTIAQIIAQGVRNANARYTTAARG